MNAAAAGAGSYVLLRAQELRLLLPQPDVGVAEYLEHEPVPTTEPGLFEYTNGIEGRIVAALSPMLRPLERFPRGRFVVTPLQTGAGELCLAWDEVRVLIDARPQTHPLPPAMRAADGPIEAWCELDGEVLLCTTGPRLLAYALASGE